MAVNTTTVIRRFLEVINQNSKEVEKEILRQNIENSLSTSKFTAVAEYESINDTTYRIDFEDFYFTNYGLTYADVESVLDEYKEAGYRCNQLRDNNGLDVPDNHVLRFQIFIKVSKTTDVIGNIPANINYFLPSQCSIYKT